MILISSASLALLALYLSYLYIGPTDSCQSCRYIRGATSMPIQSTGCGATVQLQFLSVSDFRFRVSGFGFRVWISSIGFRLWSFGFRLSGFVFRVSEVRPASPGGRLVVARLFNCSASCFWVSGIGFRLSGFVSRISDHPGGKPGANLNSILHRCYLREVAFEWELTK